MSKNILTPEAGISIIEQSLKNATNQKTGASTYYIIWGSVLFVFFIAQFIAYHFKTASAIALADWSMLVFPIGGVLSFLQSRSDDKKETNVPLNEKLYSYAWIGASISLGVLCVGDLKNLQVMLCIGTLVVFGLVNFIIGGITKFKPFLIGGGISILLAVLIPSLTLDYKFLVTSIGVLCSCLLPGLLMKNTEANV